MPTSIPQGTLDKFTTFGDLLRFLRRRAGITQMELSIAVGYSDAQICRLEQNLRLPDPPTIEARFVPALLLEDEPLAVARLVELAASVRREDAPEPGMCPYKGLEYFDEADAGLFVGREALSAKLAERVLSRALKPDISEIKFLAIVGASGSGKSSLVRAGLVPALRWNKNAANWQIYVFTPSAHPLESLAVTLSQENGSVTPITSMIDDMRRDPRSLSLYLRRWHKASGAPYLLLVIDQFEELFALCHSEEERSAFIDNLLVASSEQDGQLIIVITLRADFYAHCAGFLKLREALATHQEYIGAMNDEEMRRAIEEPARRGRWDLEAGLVDLILHDVGHEPGALPLLSHALLETWQRRHGRTLSLSGYTSAGGVRGAIAETAETVFTDQFTHAQQAIARRIFLRLTELGDETATGDTRRRASYKELIRKPEETDATKAVLKALADARLVTTSEDSVEVAHEALIREWPTLRTWLEDNREGLRLHHQLTEAAQEWLAAGREPDLLFRGARLAQANEWASTHAEDLNVQEREFLAASIESTERDIAEREAARQRELQAAQRLAEVESRRAEQESTSKNKLRKRAVYLSVALAMMFFLGILAVFLANQANQNAALAVMKQSTANAASIMALKEANSRATAEANAITQQSLAEAASTQAIDQANIRATAEAKAVAQAALNRSLNLSSSAQLANQAGRADASLALALESVKLDQPPPEAIALLRKVATNPGTRFILNGHSHEVRATSISPDNHLAFSGSCANLNADGACLQGELIVWDLDARKEIHRWTAHTGWVSAVAFSQDGQILISGGQDGDVILWDVVSGKEIRQLPRQPGSIIALVIKTDTEAGGETLITGSADGTLAVWDPETASPLQRFEGSSSMLTSIAVASKSPFAVTGYHDGSLILWNLNNPQPIRKIEISGDPVGGVAISSDGSFIISAQGLSLRKIDSQSGTMIEQHSTGHTWGQVVISPEDKYTFSPCSGIIQWDIDNWRQQKYFVDDETITILSISQDGRMGISGNLFGDLRLWNLVDSLDYQTFNTGLSSPDSVAVSPDGQTLFLGNIITDTQSPVVWDIADGQISRTFQGFISTNAPDSVAISPDGRYAVAGGGALFTGIPELIVWNMDSGEQHCHLGDEYRMVVRGLSISPDSRFLLAGSQAAGVTDGEGNQELILWDIQSCQLMRRFEMNPDEDVTGVAFSSDGKWAATGTAYNYRVILWDVSTGREISRFPLPNSTSFSPIFDLAFGPDDRTILAPVADQLYLWDIETGAVLRHFSGHSTFIWSVDVSSDGKYVLSGSDNGEVILWDFLTGEELYRLDTQIQPVMSVKFSPDGTIAYSISTDGLLTKWKIPVQTLPELLQWIQANRYVRQLSCEERLRYSVLPLCGEANP